MLMKILAEQRVLSEYFNYIKIFGEKNTRNSSSFNINLSYNISLGVKELMKDLSGIETTASFRRIGVSEAFRAGNAKVLVERWYNIRTHPGMIVVARVVWPVVHQGDSLKQPHSLKRLRPTYLRTSTTTLHSGSSVYWKGDIRRFFGYNKDLWT